MDFINGICIRSPNGVWGGAPAANDLAAFWTEMEASAWCDDFEKCHGFHQWYVSSPSGVWGGAPAANDFGAFWTKMEASSAMILNNVSWISTMVVLCKLPQRGLGQSPSRQRFCCILD